jgi:hypothetical protein
VATSRHRLGVALIDPDIPTRESEPSVWPLTRPSCLFCRRVCLFTILSPRVRSQILELLAICRSCVCFRFLRAEVQPALQ